MYCCAAVFYDEKSALFTGMNKNVGKYFAVIKQHHTIFSSFSSLAGIKNNYRVIEIFHAHRASIKKMMPEFAITWKNALVE
jgi:hypothetical protein